MKASTLTPLPYLTAEHPGVGGILKQHPEDFIVEELPLYEPSGEGDHLFLWVEKRDLSAELLTQHIAAALGISRDDVGMAGLKDRRAITRQYVSVPTECEARIAEIDSAQVRVLSTTRHANKLKTGHLCGNRFDIHIAETVAEPLSRSEPIADMIRATGFPNYYGEQRFGDAGETLTLGIDLLAGRKTERDIPRNRRRFLLRLSLSAVQSAVFNEVLRRRIDDGLLNRVLPGDVMQVRSSGGPFIAEDIDHEQERCDQGEICISGPMYGVKMRHPTGEAAEREREVLASFGLNPLNFRPWKKRIPGTRRPMVATVVELSLSGESNRLGLSFKLNRGTYATSLLREFMKVESTHPECPSEPDQL
ncbi:MAG: tRNA pseudouridine(13) synthase TruD [Planctomycetaceae bacterium]|nr:tRNA pseudouridine(13) synthase TruD [Planctomycetaceae bacterium]